MKQLETDRLILRAWRYLDVEDFYEYASMEDVGVHAGWPRHESIEVSKEILKNFIESHDVYALVDKENNKVIGSLGIHNHSLEEYKDVDQRMIGYALNKNYWGKGLMTEALNRVHEYLFNDVGVDMVWVEHFVENHRSKRVIIKVGFDYIKDSTYDAKLLGKMMDCHQYILTKEKFEKMNGIKKEYPILEFDRDKDAFINPSVFIGKYKAFSRRLIVCFFHNLIDTLVDEGKLEPFETISGENKVYVYKFVDDDCLVVKGYVGGAGCGGELEECIALGSRQITFCGGAGSLHPDITVGKIVLVDSAVRDEGFSYHYLKPSREVYANKKVLEIAKKFLGENEVDYITGKVWTTDAFYRETREKIKLRTNENCLMVEMEQAGLLALTQFRNVNYAALVYGGDDLTKSEWDQRGWTDRKDIREKLIYLCKDLSREMDKQLRG